MSNSMYIEIDSIEMHDLLIKQSKICVIDFYANYCGPCKKVAPLLESAVIADSNLCKFVSTGEDDLDDKIVFAKLNIETQEELAEIYKINTIPQFSFYKNGELQSDKVVGGKVDEVIKTVKKLAEI